MSLNPLADATCPGSPLPPTVGTPPANRTACSELAGGTGLLHAQLLVGVQTAPAHSQRRAAIRASWMQWESVGRSVVVCFLIGRDGLSKARARSLEAEAALYRDVLLLDVADRVVLSLPKTFGWWQAAAALIAQGTAVRWVAKVDDDSFVHLPNLEAGLRRLHCHPHLYLGSFARCGYDPVRLAKCGFSWTGSGNSRRYGCQARGAEPPTLFALGAVQVRMQCNMHCAGSATCTCSAHAVHTLAAPLVHKHCSTLEHALQHAARHALPPPHAVRPCGAVQVLAAPLVHALAASPGLPTFLEHAHEMRREYKVDSEDVALGYWLARRTPLQPPLHPLAEAQGPQQGPRRSALPLAAPPEHAQQYLQHVQYVQMPPNSVFNVHCFLSKGMYQVVACNSKYIYISDFLLYLLTHLLIFLLEPILTHSRTYYVYQVPDDAAWVVHHLKRPQGMGYLWRRLHDRAPHDADACLTATAIGL